MTAPKVIGPYEIVELLGRGGMGEVYKAVDTRMYRRPVALKILSEAMGDDPRALKKFDLEIETAANLRHPNIVQIYDRGEHDGRRYFAMELLEGEDLSAVIVNRGSRALEARLEIILQLCDALDYAHAQGVVHRDIKPANILVVGRGGTDHVKLVDFGIAHHAARVDQTKTAIQPGTLLYMSPEQLKDESVAPASDLFSLGIVAYELCTGVHPFKAKTQYLASSNIMFEKHPPLRTLEPDAPESLENLLDDLLQKHRADRPASAGAVASQIKDIVRRLRAGASDSEPGSFGNLDEMTGSMVERIVHWAKTKEAEGALVQAIEGFKRATLLAPGAQWLHTRVARLEEQLLEATAPAASVADDSDSGASSKDRHRETFVRARMTEADAALDEGDLNRASSIAAAVLRRYSDDAQALALLDRIVLITDRGLSVKTYRQALRTAREALANGDLPSALRSCETAVAIWPDDGDVITLGREIEKARQVELAKAVKRCDDLIARSAVVEAGEALQRAQELGMEASLVAARRASIDRVEREAKERREKERLAREEQERQESERREREEKERLGQAEKERREREESERRERQESERREREEKERVAQAEKERREREERERQERLEKDRIEREERAARERAALKAERVRALVAESRAAFVEAQQLAGSIETEADRMIEPLDKARRVAEEALKIEADQGDAKALLSKIETLRMEAARHADHAAGLRRDAARLRREEEAARRAQRAASMKRWLAYGCGLVVVGLVALGAAHWLGLRRAAEQRAHDETAARAHENAAAELLESGARIEKLRATIAEIVTEAARKNALSECDDVSRVLDDVGRLDASNADLPRMKADLSDVRGRIGSVAIAPPAFSGTAGGDAVLQAAVLEIEKDLRFAGNAPAKPVAAVEDAIARADRGIAAARDVLKSHPDESRARRLLEELEATRPRLQERRKTLLDKRRKDLEAAAVLVGRASSSADCDKAQSLLSDILRDDPGQTDALNLQGRLSNIVRTLKDRDAKTGGAPKGIERPPTVPQPPLRDEVETLVAKAKQQPLSTEEGLTARIAANREALRRVAAAGGAEWAADASRAVEADLGQTLIMKLFHDYSRAVRARDTSAVLAVFPAYKGRAMLEDARAIEFDLKNLTVESDLGGATATQSMRILPSAGSWQGPYVYKFRFTLRRQGEHFVIVDQKLL